MSLIIQTTEDSMDHRSKKQNVPVDSCYETAENVCGEEDPHKADKYPDTQA